MVWGFTEQDISDKNTGQSAWYTFGLLSLSGFEIYARYKHRV